MIPMTQWCLTSPDGSWTTTLDPNQANPRSSDLDCASASISPPHHVYVWDAFLIAIAALIIFSVARWIWRRWIDPWRRAHTPGCVPRGIPSIYESRRGYGWLRRNEYGAIDMSQYTASQWRSTKLKYCKKHMTHPGESVLYKTHFDEWGNAYAIDPCDCGKIIGIERALDSRDWHSVQFVPAMARTAATWVGLSALQDLKHPVKNVERTAGGGAALLGLTAGAFALRNVALRNLVKRLFVHPEIEGRWVTHFGFERYGPTVMWRSMGPLPYNKRWDGKQWTEPYYPPAPPEPEPELPPAWGGPAGIGLSWGKKW